MKNLKISDFWIYKFRYQIGIGIISLSYLAIIIYTLLFAPNGLTAGEIESTKKCGKSKLFEYFFPRILSIFLLDFYKKSASIFSD